MQVCVPGFRRVAEMVAPAVVAAALCLFPIHVDARQTHAPAIRHHVQHRASARATAASAFGGVSDVVLRGEPGAPVACALAGDFEPYHRHRDALPARLFAPAQHAVYFRRGRGGACTVPGMAVRG